MYERFTDRAQKVMQFANQEAAGLNHDYIGTEHLLMALVREGSGVGASVLMNLNVDLPKIRAEVKKLIAPGPKKVAAGKLPQTPRAKHVIEYAMEEAHKLNHHVVGTEHLLLGLLREEEGVAVQVLMNLGLKLDAVRAEVEALLARPEHAREHESFLKGPRNTLEYERFGEYRGSSWVIPALLTALVAAVAVIILLLAIIIGR